VDEFLLTLIGSQESKPCARTPTI